jgi:8-oxo-dGTP pyrophosphatase MutT (NUDIX family)
VSDGSRQLIPRPPAWSLEPAREWRTDLDLASLVGAPPVIPLGSVAHEPLTPDALLSAVLVLLTDGMPARDGVHVLVTRRAAHLRNHAGEVSFPGGRVEPGESAVAAALREADEEVALSPTGLSIHGEIAHVHTFVSRSYIVPVVATVAAPPALTPHPGEVEAVFWVALADLVADGVHRTERWVRGELDWLVEFFELPHDTIWGATARMLVDLLAVREVSDTS